MSSFKNKLVRIARENAELRPPILAVLKEAKAPPKKRIKVRRKDTGRVVWIYPETLRSERTKGDTLVKKEDQHRGRVESKLRKLLEHFSSYCMDHEEERHTIANHAAGILKVHPKKVDKVLVEQRSKCLDEEEERKEVYEALLHLR